MNLNRGSRSYTRTIAIIFALVVMSVAPASVSAQTTRDPSSQNTGTDIHFHKFQPSAPPDAASTSVVTRTQAEIDALIAQQIGLLEQEKTSRTPAQQKIDSNVLYTIRMMKGQAPAPGIASLYTGVDLDDNNNIVVDITANVTDTLLGKLQSAGAMVLNSNAEYRSIRAIIPPNQIEGIATLADVTFIDRRAEDIHGHITRGPGGTALERWRKMPGFEQRAARVRKMLSSVMQKTDKILTGSGSVDTEGDITHRAFDARGIFGVNGAGLKIGVLSDSANATGALTSAQGTGDMPPTCPGPGGPCVTVLQDFGGGGDEGTAMMEIIYDLAPGASLMFATADAGESAFASNITALRTAGCDIIVDDVFYFDEPVFQDGIVAQAVNGVIASGGLYFSSAGNEGNVDSGTAGYFEGDFNDAGSATFTFPGGAKTGTIHNFGTVGTPINGDVITISGDAYTLNWADPHGASGNDYDLFLVNSAGIIKAQSTNIQNGTQNPFEQINPPTLAIGDRLVVFKTTAAAVRAFAINTIRGTLTQVTGGQTHGHSAASGTNTGPGSAPGVFSVSAAPAAGAFSSTAPAGPFPNPFTTANLVEPFTSDGPRRIFFTANGTPISAGNFTFASSGFVTRNKPDITAADGVSTTLPAGSGLNPFYGTSAAAPHAAAIAALIKSANPALTQAQIQATLFGTALDIMASGYDRDSGNGIVMAYQAVASLGIPGQANPEIASVVASQNPGNGDGNIKPGEGAKLVIQLQNTSGVLAATGITATLTTTTPGITVLLPNISAYADIAAGATGGTNLSTFKFVLASNVPCAAVINFTLTVNYSGSLQRVLSFTVPTSSISFSNNLGTTPTPITGFTTLTGTQQNRISRTGLGTGSVCGTLKTFPGVISPSVGPRAFDSYTFTPSTAGCVSFILTSGNLFGAIYVAGFDPNNIQNNYLGDTGTSGSSLTCALIVNSGTSYTFVVSDVTGSSVGSPYTLTIPVCSTGTINQLPVARAHNVQVTSAVPGGSANASIDNGSSDPDGDTITLTQTPPGPYPHGVTTVILTATDSVGGASQASATVTVIDPGPDLTVLKTHSGNFTQGQVGATYTITVTNSGGTATSGTVTMVDTLPTPALSATALTGTGWGCTLATLTCTRSDALNPGLSYPGITLTVTVAANAPASVTNTSTVSGGGEVNTANDVWNDQTTITPTLPDLAINKSHVGNFSQGQIGAQYTITVNNNAGSAATTGQVTVVDTLPSALTATAMSGTGWTCVLATLTCNRSDPLAVFGSYPAITLTVNVSTTALPSVTNTATVSGGGETNLANDVATDPTTIVTFANLQVVKGHFGNFVQGQVGATYSISVTNFGTGTTTGQVNVVDTLPASITATAMSGTGWTCVVATVSCSRSDGLTAGQTYANITLTVNVAANAPASVTNTVVVSGGGEIIVNDDSFSNPTTILTPPTATLSTNTLTFPITTVGTQSSAMSVTVTNNGQASLTFTQAPTISGTNSADFGIVNTSTCAVANPVAGGGSCVINITITPGAAGPRGPATLTLTDNASTSPQTVTLNGTGDDFGEAGPGSAVTVSAGQTANFTITITPGTGGFPSAITFSQTGAPTMGTTITFNPPSVTPGNSSASTTMIITTTSRAGIAPPPGRHAPRGPLPIMLWLLAAATLAASLLLMRKNNQKRRLGWAGMAAAAVLVAIGLVGCGGGGGGGGGGNPNGTPAGTSNITVTGTSGTLSHSTVVTLTVQ
jgi:uncharacterized repeat protein (TIGR01451 family)